MDESRMPPLSKALIDELDRRFPERSADLQWADREVWFKAGQRDVVRFLIEQFNRQNENILEN